MNAHLVIRSSSYLYFCWVWVGIYKINGFHMTVDCSFALGMEPIKNILIIQKVFHSLLLPVIFVQYGSYGR